MAKTLDELPQADISAIFGNSGESAPRMALAAQEQGPIFRWTGRERSGRDQTYVGMVGPEANRFVLHTHRDRFLHAPGWDEVIGDVFGKGVLNTDAPAHPKGRRQWTPVFSGPTLDAHFAAMQRVIEGRVRDWGERGEIDVAEESRKLTFDVVASAVLGLDPGPKLSRFCDQFHTLLHVTRMTAGLSESFDERALMAQMELLAGLLRTLRARKPDAGGPPPRDGIGRMIQEGEMTEQELLGHVRILLLAGHETTTSLLAWVLYQLAAYPAQRERIGREARPLPDGGITQEQMKGMADLDNFVKEVGRCYSPLVHLPLCSAQPFEFGGYEIPAGLQVRLSVGGGHRLPRVFQDPDHFDPDRFAPPREEDRRTPYSLITFSSGPRTCIGQPFALLEVKTVALELARRFAPETLNGQRPVHAGFYNARLEGDVRIRIRKAST